MRVLVSGVPVDIHTARTAAYVAQAPALDCPCRDCQHFLHALPLLPAEARDGLASLGVDLRKAVEVYTLGPPADGRIRYGGFMPVCATMPEDVDQTDLLAFTEDCGVSFSRSLWLRPRDFPEPALQLTFTLTLPWAPDASQASP